MFVILHVQDIHDHLVDDLDLAICLGVEGSGFGELSVQQYQRLDKNVLRNQMSRSETMVCGIPKCTHTRSKKSLPVASIVMLFLQAIRIAILEK
jgi:hypothetical protein